MPTVYKDRLNISGMNARVNVRTSGDDFGAIEAGSMREAAQSKSQQAQGNATLARGLLDVGSAVFQINERLDEANANELDARYTEFERSMLHDPKNGYYAKQGKDALDGRAPLETSIKERIGTLAKDARSPRARAAFYQLAQRRAGDTFSRADAYAQDQLRVYENTTDEAKIAEATNNAALQYNDPAAFRANIDTVIGTSTRMARRLGLSGDAERNYVQTKQSAAYGTSIIAMAASDPEKADALFKEVRGGMTVGDATRVENTLRPAVMDAKARGETDRIWNEVGNDYGAAMEAADGIKDTALRDATVSRLDHKFAQIKKADGIAEEASMKVLAEIITRGGSIYSLPLDQRKNISPQTWLSLVSSERSASKAAIAETEKAHKETSKIYRGALDAMAADPSSSSRFAEPGFLESKMEEWSLTPEDSAALLEKRGKLRSGQNPTTSLVASTYTDARKIAEPIMGKYGLDLSPGKDDTSGQKRKAAFESALYAETSGFVETNKRAPTPKENQEIIFRAIAKGDAFKDTALKSSGGKNVKAATSVTIPYAEIPQADRDAVLGALKKRYPNQVITNYDVRNEYTRLLVASGGGR